MNTDTSWSVRFRYLMMAVVGLAVAAFIWDVREMIAPLVISALLAFVLSPAVDTLTRRTRLSQRWAAIIVFAASLLVLLAIPAITTPILVNEARLLEDDLEQVASQIQTTVSQPIRFMRWDIHLEGLLPDFSQISTESLTPVAESALQILESATRNLAWILVILVATYYLLQDWKRLRGWVVGVVPEAYQPDVRRLLREINNIWRAYLRGQLTWMLAVGVVVTIALLIIGTPGGVVLGVLTGLFSLLPDLGPAIAALLTVTVALFEGSSYLALSNLWFAALVIIVYLVAINAMNIFLRPRILGRSVKLHEGVVFIAIISAVVLQGVLGALIILPVISSTAVIGRYLRRRILGMPPFPEPVEPPPDESDGSSIESKDEN